MTPDEMTVAIRALQKRVAALELGLPRGTPGTGACICFNTEDVIQRKHTVEEWLAKGYNIRLDHRCAHHGQLAQPALWGRHKDLSLLITFAEWNSLGVTHS